MYPSIIHINSVLAQQEEKSAEQEKFAAIRYSKIYNCAAKLKKNIWHYDLYHYIKLAKLAKYDWFCLLTPMPMFCAHLKLTGIFPKRFPIIS